MPAVPLRRSRGAAALLAALALVACHPRQPPPDLSRDPGPLLAQVRAAQAQVQRVSGEARVKVEAKGMRSWVSVREFIAAEKPDRLHVEVLDFFGNVGAVLVAEGGRFQLYDAKERVFYRGEATPENLSRLVPLPLPAEDLVTLLCGSAPLLETPVDVEVRDGALVLSLEGNGRAQDVRIGEEAAVERASIVAVPPGTAPAYSVDFDGFRPLKGGRFPGEVRLRSDDPRVRLDLRWADEIEVNGKLDGVRFSLDPPRGARVVELDRAAGPVPPNLFRDGTPAPSEERAPAAPAPPPAR
ncbi:DUF4292 domain-containing protein [Anaeromyxobacter sp. SG17]|uniref:DUF4292 domain-containing protein n=1 Tax=Anaeromyxobacter sp. SG17 TaxID=2925405 RepID=UPI001F56D109|nr:DUF4292 domain-containing protein [Anaeromyxobacter sp. SG17]